MVRWLALLVVVGACSKAEPSCKVRVAEAAEYLTSLDLGGPTIATETLTMVRRDDLPEIEVEDSPVVEVHPRETKFQGVLLDEATLISAHDRLLVDGAKHADRLFIVVDQDTPWERVQSVLVSAEEAGFVRPVFVFERTSTRKPPPPSRVDKQIDEILAIKSPRMRATEIANLALETIEKCPQMSQLFGQVAAADGDKAALLVEGMPAALLACDCAADPASMRNIVDRLLLNVTVAFLPVEIAADGETFDGAKRWRGIGAALQVGARLRGE